MNLFVDQWAGFMENLSSNPHQILFTFKTVYVWSGISIRKSVDLTKTDLLNIQDSRCCQVKELHMTELRHQIKLKSFT